MQDEAVRTQPSIPARAQAFARNFLISRGQSPVFPTLLFMFLSACFLWHPILTRSVFAPADVVFQYDYMWKGLQPPGVSLFAQNGLLSDVAFQFYPYHQYAIERLGAGHFPLWNPYLLGGLPFFAGAQPAVLEPINLLTYPLGILALWTVGAWLRMTLLGLGTYAFSLALGRTRAGAIASAVVFMACGFVTVWLNYGIVYTLAWVPLLFWATTKLLQTGHLTWLAASALFMGAMLLGGHPETQFLMGLLWLAYCLYSLSGPGERLRRVRSVGGAVLGAGVAGLAIGAVQWATFAGFLLQSNGGTTRHLGFDLNDLGDSLLRFAVLIFPNFAGNPASGNYWYGANNFNEITGYIGLSAAALAVVGAVYRFRQDRAVRFFAVFAALGLFFTVQTPGSQFIRVVPLFDIGQGVRWATVWSFSAAILTGYGADALSRVIERRAIRRTGLVLTAAAAAGLAILLCVYLGVLFGGWDAAWPTGVDHSVVASVFSPVNLALYLPVGLLVLSGLVILARARGMFGAGSMATLLVLILYFDLWFVFNGYNPVTPANAVYPRTSTIEYLQQSLGHDRFAGIAGLMWPNTAMVFNLRDLRGYEILQDPTFNRLYGPVLASLVVSGTDAIQLSPEQQRLLSMASLHYLATVRKVRVGESTQQYRTAHWDGEVYVYQNLDSLPRAYIVYDSVASANIEDAIGKVTSPDFDPRRSVVLTGGGVESGGASLDYRSTPVIWHTDQPEEVTLEADLPSPGYLVLTDTYNSDWQASVDGEGVSIVRANAVFRAVPLPRGEHTIVFQYRPALFYWAAGISVTALTGVLVLGVLGFMRKGRKGRVTC